MGRVLRQTSSHHVQDPIDTGVLNTLVYMGDLVSDVAKPTYLADRYTSSCPCGMLDRESCS